MAYNKRALELFGDKAYLNELNVEIITNSDRKINKNPRQKGENHTGSKLTMQDVDIIRKKYNNGISQTELSKEFNISKSTIHNIVYNKAWKYE
jgi:DNA-binding transcriptional regulator YiaG